MIKSLQNSFFWIIVQGLIVMGFYVIWIGWRYYHFYTGFQCWILETILWYFFTINIINIFPEEK